MTKQAHRLLLLLLVIECLVLANIVVDQAGAVDWDVGRFFRAMQNHEQPSKPYIRGKPLPLLCVRACWAFQPYHYIVWRWLAVALVASGALGLALATRLSTRSWATTLAAPLVLLFMPAVRHISAEQDDNMFMLPALALMIGSLLAKRPRPLLLGLSIGLLLVIHAEAAPVLVVACAAGLYLWGRNKMLVAAAPMVLTILAVDLTAMAVWPEAPSLMRTWIGGAKTLLGGAAGTNKSAALFACTRPVNDALYWFGLDWTAIVGIGAVVGIALRRTGSKDVAVLGTLTLAGCLFPSLYEGANAERWVAAAVPLAALAIVAVWHTLDFGPTTSTKTRGDDDG
ncbi:MAG: hypothetical protein P9M14_15785 [Candidatus Alcyoniella australis]|nr:hypothetical protein [Candidatus Alcyoniella australis]